MYVEQNWNEANEHADARPDGREYCDHYFPEPEELGIDRESFPAERGSCGTCGMTWVEWLRRHEHHFPAVTSPDGLELADIADCECGMTWDEHIEELGAFEP